MNRELRQQIDIWTEADEHQKVIDALENIAPEKRDFEEIGLLARAYNYIDEYDTALTLLQSIQEEGKDDTNWNFRMGYALYYLDRSREALAHFRKADELTPDDEDTIDFIRCCNKEMPFRARVDAFWQWFLQNEAELSKLVEKRDEYDSDQVLGLIDQGLGLISEDIYFNMGGDYEFTFSIEGNEYLFYLYPYLISRMPEQLKGKWHFSPYNQGADAPFSFQMYGAQIDMQDVYVHAHYDEQHNDFAVSFYEEHLCSLPEAQAYNAFYIMMELMLGEGLSYQYIANVKRVEKLEEEMFPLPELRSYITETLKANGKQVFENPKDVFISYRLEPKENEELRYDVAIGTTRFSHLISQYYEGDTGLFDKLNQFGAQAVFLAFPYDNIGADERKAVLDFRYKLEDRIEKEILNQDGLGLLLGGATGTGSCYIDLLLYDVNAFLDKVVPVLREYSEYSFYLSDFRQHCMITRLSASAESDD
uniref:Tetratricopeptide repeat protein n=1 Tax=Prevotella sp. GTC17254 TaxID=3236794 RepID=A0AB33J0C9_9BACT